MKNASLSGTMSVLKPNAFNSSDTTGPTDATGVAVERLAQLRLETLRLRRVDQPAHLAGAGQRDGVDAARRHLLDRGDDVPSAARAS